MSEEQSNKKMFDNLTAINSLNQQLLDECNNIFFSVKIPKESVQNYYPRMATLINRYELVMPTVIENLSNLEFKQSYYYRIEQALYSLHSELEYRLEIVKALVEKENVVDIGENIVYLQDKVEDSVNTLDVYKTQMQSQNLSKILNEAKEKVSGLETAKNKYETRLTEKIYSKVYEELSKKAFMLEILFGIVLVLGIVIALIIFEVVNLADLEIVPKWLKILNIHSNNPNNMYSFISMISLRILIASVFFALATFLLRRASSFRKIADQAHQTSLELEALPLFVQSLREEDRYDVYRDLVPKYFGKQIDQTQNDKVGDLIQDQAKMSINIAKATTEMVKSLKDVKSDQDSKKDDSK